MPLERVTGIGGIFFKAQDPEKLTSWYCSNLGLELQPDGGVIFPWRDAQRPERRGYTVWSPFKATTRYFEPSAAPFMINFRVDDLDAMLAQLRAAGVAVDVKMEESEYGRFGWIMDPEGNRVELWEPPKEPASSPG